MSVMCAKCAVPVIVVDNVDWVGSGSVTIVRERGKMDIQTEGRATMTLDELRGVVEAQGGVDVRDLGEYAENCWSGC